MSLGSEQRDAEALRDEFAELIRREPACDMDAVFDAAARQRFGRAISRMAASIRQDERRSGRG